MTINYIVSGTITDAGITSAINAGSTGPNFNVTGFRIGSLSALDGAKALPTDTDVDGFVYQGSPSQLSYTIVDMDTIMWTIALDTTVGNFQIGNVGITLQGNVLLCKAVYPTQTSKYMSDPPSTIGNVLYFKILMRLSNIANLVNVTIIESLTASLPEVPTEAQLPDAFASPYNAYMVDNHTKLGTPTVALRLNGNWYHAGHYSSAGMNDTVLPVPPTMFDIAIPVTSMTTSAASALVAYDPVQHSFVKMDNAVTGIYCMGLRVAPHQIVTKGFIKVDPVFLGTLTPGAIYYADTGSNAGKLTTTENNSPIGLAIYNNYIWVDLEAFNSVGYATYTKAGTVRWATQTEVNSGFDDITGPVVKPDTLMDWATNGTLFNLLKSKGGEWDLVQIDSNYTPTKFNVSIEIKNAAGTTNIVLPSPVSSLNNVSLTGQGFRVINKSSITQRVATPVAIFTSPYYSSSTPNYYYVLAGCIVDFISDGTNWVVIDYYRIANQTYYGVARQATMTEALNGVTTGLAPAFITPEELSAALGNNQSGSVFDPMAGLGVGSYIWAMNSGFTGADILANSPAVGSTHTWTSNYTVTASGGVVVIANVVDNEQSLYIPAAALNNGADVANGMVDIVMQLDSRFTSSWPSGAATVSNPPTLTVPQGVWKVMYITSEFLSYQPYFWTGTTFGLTKYNRLFNFITGYSYIGSTASVANAANALFWLKRIS